MSKLVLKEQIKFGKCDPTLFHELRIVEGITDFAVQELLSKRAQLIELKKGKSIPFQDKYYKLLFGEYEIKDNYLYATQNCDIITLEKSLVEYFQQEELMRKNNQYIEVIRQIGIFNRLDHQQMITLINRAQILRVNENRVLYSEGQVPSDCIVVIKGSVELSKNIQGIQIIVDQNRKQIAIFECLNAQKLQYNVITTKQTHLLVINRETLLQLEPFLKKEQIKNYSVEQREIKQKKEWLKIKKRILDDVSMELNKKRTQRKLRTLSQY